MKRMLSLGSVALCLAAMGVAQTRQAVPQQQSTAGLTRVKTSQAATPISAAAQSALLDQYCVTCHSDRIKRANLSLEKLDLSTVGDNPQLWEKVIRKLRAGVMPPPGMRRPPLPEYESFRDWLETEIDKKAAQRG